MYCLEIHKLEGGKNPRYIFRTIYVVFITQKVLDSLDYFSPDYFIERKDQKKMRAYNSILKMDRIEKKIWI